MGVVAPSSGLRDSIKFFLNKADGTFEDKSGEAQLEGLTGGINLCHADYNNDGHVDVYVIRGAWQQDGWLDLCVGNESRGINVQIPIQLFRNNRDGTFTECARELGVNVVAFVRGIVWGDYNNDGRQDLYISCWYEDNFLFKNTADGFEKVIKEAGVPGPRGSFPTGFWDYNNDGWLDIFAAGAPDSGDDTMATQTAFVLARGGLGEEPRVGDCNSLYRNNGNGTFADLVREAKIAVPLMPMGANFGDLDNDGYPDFYIGSGNIDFSNLVPNRMFRNAGGKFFQDVTTSGGFGHLQKGHGIAFVDMDNDGDQDIYAVMGGSYSGDAFQNALFLNPGHGNHWISLKLEGRQTNRSAIGVRVRVNVSTAEGERDIYTVVSEGGSFGASAFRRDIGLGKATAIQFLEIHWPTTGKTQKFEDVTMDKSYKLIEGGAEMEEVKLKRLKFAVGGEPSGQLLP